MATFECYICGDYCDVDERGCREYPYNDKVAVCDDCHTEFNGEEE